MLRKIMTSLVALTIAFSIHASVNAGGSDYTFTATGGSGSTGDSFTSAALLDNAGSDIQGWSLGMCVDPAALTVNGANSGADTATANDGDTPDFDQIGIFTTGATQGVVLCFVGCSVIGAVSDFEMMTMDLTIAGSSATTISFCDTNGTPPVSTVVVVGGASIPPAQNSASVDVINPNQITASSSTAVLGGAASTP